MKESVTNAKKEGTRCKRVPVVAKYSGFNDLVVGSQRITLYENYRFYLELGFGGTEGNYIIKGDTIIFDYDKKPSGSWPDKMLMGKNRFITINFSDQDKNRVSIDRYK